MVHEPFDHRNHLSDKTKSLHPQMVGAGHPSPWKGQPLTVSIHLCFQHNADAHNPDKSTLEVEFPSTSHVRLPSP